MPDHVNRPPVHFRYNESQVVEVVTKRYQMMAEKLPRKQITNLQRSEGFVLQCEGLYQEGFKDWVLLMAIWNVFFSVELERSGFGNARSEDLGVFFKKFSEMKLKTPLPVEYFLGDRFRFQVCGYEGAVLMSLGFHMRVKRHSPETVHRFLRDRMRMYDFDVPHDALFSNPPGKWPFQ